MSEGETLARGGGGSIERASDEARVLSERKVLNDSGVRAEILSRMLKNVEGKRRWGKKLLQRS